MALPASYDSKDAAPEALREHLVERDGKFFVEVDGMKTSADFDGFQEALRKRLADGIAELKAATATGLKREDIVEIIKEAGGSLGNKKDDKGGGGGDDASTSELKRQLAAVNESLAALKADNDKQVQTARTASITTAITTATTKSAPKPECVETVSRLLKGEFELSDAGEPRTKAGCEFGSNLSPDEVVAKIKRDPRFPFWPSSKGGGAESGDGGGDGGGGEDGPNPWARATWNRTRQVQIQTKDKAKAEKLAKAAGSSVGATQKPLK